MSITLSVPCNKFSKAISTLIMDMRPTPHAAHTMSVTEGRHCCAQHERHAMGAP